MPLLRAPWKYLTLASAISIAFLGLLLFAPRLSIRLRLPAFRTSSHGTTFFTPQSDLCGKDGDSAQDGDFCAYFPHHLLEDIQIVVKTGIGERERLKFLLTTFGSCISNILIMSDVNGNVLGHEVYDILADLPPVYAIDNPDWDIYAKQQEAYKAGKNVEKSKEGWKLDRFKFLPMIERTWRVRPDKKWYVFIEADTYYFWDTLFRVLGKINPNERHYLGAAVAGAHDVWFGYGGAGFVLSWGLMQEINRVDTHRMSEKHAGLIKGDCCGDTALAYALHRELGVRIENLHPTFSGDEPQWLEVDEQKKCIPLLALHRVAPETMKRLWRWERCRAFTGEPLTYMDMLEFGLTPTIPETAGASKAFWDNGAYDAQSTNSSAMECFQACDASSECYQSTYFEGTCRFAPFARLGRPVEHAMLSSWNVEGLARLGWTPGDGINRGTCRGKVDWQVPMVSPAKYASWT